MPDGIYRSVDQYATWVALADGYFEVLLINPADPSHIFVGCGPSGNPYRRMEIRISTDGGGHYVSRTIQAAPEGYVRAIAINPHDDMTIYVGGECYPGGTFQSALFKTTDGGSAWQDIRGTLPDVAIASIQVDPVDPSAVLVQAGSELFKSADAGATWGEITPPLGITAFRIDPEAPNEIYASSGDDFLLSEDGGETWTSIGGELPIPDVTVIDLVPSIKMVYAGTNGGGIYRNRRASLYAVSVSAGPGGTTQPGPGVSGYADGATLEITAVPQSGYAFLSWTGDRSGTANPLQITVDSDIGVKAMFHLMAPGGLTLVRQEARSFLMLQYINILSWTRLSQVPTVSGYRIYLMNGESRTLLAEVDPSTSTYWHRGVSKTGFYRYAVAAVDADGTEGEAALTGKAPVAAKKRYAAKDPRR